jgi:glycosyltransferase involved in cell wall biosynthesis
MRIGIEGQRLYRQKKHGMDMVALELIKNLQSIDKKNEYLIFVKPGKDNACIPPAPNFKIVELKGGPYPLWEQLALPRAAKAGNCDLLHCTGNTGPVWSGVPLVVTLHDIIYIESNGNFKKGGSWYQKLGNIYRRWVVPPLIKKSKAVVTVSRFEKNRIQQFMGQEEKLISIYNGVGTHFKKITDPATLEQVKNRYNLPEDFFFFLGNTAPKKNTPNVLRAFAQFKKQKKTPFKLVMSDYKEKILVKTLNEIGYTQVRDDIHLTGYVPNADMPAILSQSKIFLYPSLRESFGIPILEGMACGVPVITSNTSSMPEIAGDAAVLIDPHKPEEITAAIRKVLYNTDYREALIRKGMKKVSKFSWQNMAKEYLEVYEEVYKTNKTK